jgi:IS1 family transposase
LEERKEKKTHRVGGNAGTTRLLYIRKRRKTNTRKNSMTHFEKSNGSFY